MPEMRRFEFVLEAEQPIAHLEESVGNVGVFMRRKVRLPDGSFARVPVVTADTMRHGLREAAAYAYLDAAGLLDDPQLSEGALRLLFSGGVLSGPQGSTVNLAEYWELCDLFPPLSLLGGCAGNRIVPGKLYVDDALLVCRENAHLLPRWVFDWLEGAQGKADLESARAHLEEVQRVRMDPILDSSKRRLLRGADAARAELRLLAAEAAAAEDDARAELANKSLTMPHRFERVVAGSLFWWRVEAVCHSPLDVDTFHVMCAAFLSNARVGGKRGQGCGKLRAVAGRNVEVLRPAERVRALESADQLAPKVGELFRAHVRERADKIREWLAKVEA